MIFRLALAVLLLFAQHVALAHQAQHSFDPDPLQLQHAGDDKNFHSDLCAFHSDFESLLSAVGSTAPTQYLSSTVFEQLSAALPRYYPTDPIIPAARGPPYAFSLQS